MKSGADEKKNQEIEAKFPIADAASLRTRILAQGADMLLDEIYEFNLLLDRETNPLEASFERLRLRQQGNVTVLTYKRGLKKADGVAFREEIETEVDDFANMRLILERLGYTERFIYEKYRSVFRLNDCSLMLDLTPIGTYLEIEGDSYDQIMTMAERLEIDPTTAIAAGYASLFQAWKEANRSSAANMLFSN